MKIEKHIIKPYTMNGGGYRYIGQGKVPTICKMYHNVFSTFPEKPYIMEVEKDSVCVAIRGRNSLPITCVSGNADAANQDNQKNNIQQLEPRKDKKTNCLTTVQKDNMVMENKCRIRRLTPTECARLQSIPDWYEWKGKFPDGKVKPTSDTQIYKMCGNGWNVEVIKHIFSFLPESFKF